MNEIFNQLVEEAKVSCTPAEFISMLMQVAKITAIAHYNGGSCEQCFHTLGDMLKDNFREMWDMYKD